MSKVWISIHALLAESDRERSARLLVQLLFLSTLSLRRATGNDRRGCWYSCYFYPRSPYGERRMSRCTVAGSCRFLSTLSLRRATGAEIQDPGQVLFLSTLSLRRATLSKDAKDGPVLISLHALLTESDAKLTQKFEIRSKFLSTLSLRRATANGAS